MTRRFIGSRAGASLPLSAARRLPRFAEKGRRVAFAFALVAALAAPAANAFPGVAKIAPECVAVVNTAALQAMSRTNPQGQMQIFGPPTVFDPHLLRVTVRVFGGRSEIYAVDVTIDDACRVIMATTRLETNEVPYR